MKTLILVLLSIVLLEGTALADSTVCDKDTEGNAYGLCVAYCDALNCLENDRKSAACQSLLKNYVKRTEGRFPPCVSIETVDPNGCPCWTIDQIEYIFSFGDGAPEPGTGYCKYDSFYGDWSVFDSVTYGDQPEYGILNALRVQYEPDPWCSYQDFIGIAFTENYLTYDEWFACAYLMLYEMPTLCADCFIDACCPSDDE